MKSFGFKRASSKRYPANALPACPSLCHVTPSPSMQTKSGTDECRQTESHNRERRMLAPAKRKQKEARKWSTKEELCERSRAVAWSIMSPISWCRCLCQLSRNVLGNFPLQNIPVNFPKQLLAPQDAVRMLRVLSQPFSLCFSLTLCFIASGSFYLTAKHGDSIVEDAASVAEQLSSVTFVPSSEYRWIYLRGKRTEL